MTEVGKIDRYKRKSLYRKKTILSRDTLHNGEVYREKLSLRDFIKDTTK